MSETASHLSAIPAATALRVVRSRSLYERRVKRPLDVALAVFLGLVMLPIALLIALAVRVGLGPGVLYAQERVGLHGERFTIWKFRTMRHDRRREQLDSVSVDRRTDHKHPDDPRHTGLGRLLRRLSLDELPQLWNVFRGEMSIVGPRPELYDVARERGYFDHVRHDVRPGLTGPYQTSSLRGNADLRDGLTMDADYVESIGLAADVVFMLKTIRTLFSPGSSGS